VISHWIARSRRRQYGSHRRLLGAAHRDASQHGQAAPGGRSNQRSLRRLGGQSVGRSVRRSPIRDELILARCVFALSIDCNRELDTRLTELAAIAGDSSSRTTRRLENANERVKRRRPVSLRWAVVLVHYREELMGMCGQI